ncbi:hypothetical protein [Piscinibacter gummiphilus]|uniref:Uncharacterized protein n=1 Tax=Piscinibacter gummiphilus TaxID=946333 RepID=A0A1W6LAL7_9BURK|nr:hypothetical protein [Piscinibacter gummiphilus]ARN21283.1 hypothetical protein A4W93_16015 [Piscinibacter gummiphilus]ATU65968.1 hypothetical protein CPZ87_16095 [Piscinibacter gummiphilus]GLS93850.1 hypothetical protein GCM10007918_11410 [Piscinibacter gummiphilus]
MQFSQLDPWFSVSMITGPRHALLQIRIGRGEPVQPVWEQLPPVGSDARCCLDQAAITAQVLAAVDEANCRLVSRYTVTHIRCVQDDNGTPAMYGHMAAGLIDHVHGTGVPV